jgi:NADPH:quinone reductase-like Zn-dependent oxidoreductase
MTPCPTASTRVLDVVGGDEANRNPVRPQGTIVQVGLMGGGQTPVNLGLLLVKRALGRHSAETRPLEQKIALSQRFREVIRFESGALRSRSISGSLDDIVEAHRHMDANANVGKILLQV